MPRAAALARFAPAAARSRNFRRKLLFFLRMRMRSRHLAATGLLALTMGAAAAPAHGADIAASAASVRVAQCVKGQSPDARSATFRGAMRRIAGAERMWMRFVLQEQVGDARWKAIKAPGLGVWRKSRPSVRGFVHRQRVVELAQGSAYRVLVHYRWYDEDGRLIRRAKRRSAVCRQPGPLPNLRVRGVTATPIDAQTARYAVQIANRGSAPAAGFGVRLWVDGSMLNRRVVGVLGAKRLRRVYFTGPSCGSGVRADADPGDVVREANEGDNTLTLACPSSRR